MEIKNDILLREVPNSLDGELWADVTGYEGLYCISTFGRLFSIKNVKILKPSFNKAVGKNGYLKVGLSNNGCVKYKYIHRLMMISFCKVDINRSYVDHIDGNKEHNNILNLRWCSNKENSNNPSTSWKIKGKNHPQYGKKLSKEVKDKISNKLKGEKNYWYGKKMPKHTLDKLREANAGRKISESTREKMSISKKGNKNNFYGKKHSKKTLSLTSIPIFSIDENGLETSYISQSEACRILGVKSINLYKIKNGKRKYIHGLKWRYANEEESKEIKEKYISEL